MPARTDRTGGWYRTPKHWFLVATLVLPLGWILLLCRFAWVRVISTRSASKKVGVMIAARSPVESPPAPELFADGSAPAWRRYGVAVVSVILAWGLTRATPALQDVPIASFFAAVTLSTFYGHLGPGLLATVLSIAVLDYAFLPPIKDLAGGIAETLRAATFALAAALINSLHERRRRAEAQRRESEARERENLETTARELQRAHEAVASALADRENIMESVADILYTLDGSGVLKGWNRRLEYVTHFEPEELRGRLVPEMFEEDDRAAVADVIRAAARGGH